MPRLTQHKTARAGWSKAREHSVVPAALAVAVALGACGFQAGHPAAFSPHPNLVPLVSTSSRTPGTRVPARTLAEREATRLMGLARLPGSPPLLKRLPQGSPTILRKPDEIPATANLAHVFRFAILDGNPTAIVSWLRSHRPKGSGLQTTGSLGGPSPADDEIFIGFNWPSTSVFADRFLIFDVAADGTDRSAVRVDADVTFVPNRPTAERIPSGVDRVVLTITPAIGKVRTYTVIEPSAIKLVSTAIDALKRPVATFQPGGPDMCLPAARQTIVAAFFVGKATSPAVVIHDGVLFAEELTGNVEFSLGQTVEPVLEDNTWAIPHAVQQITGLRFTRTCGV